jgi:hypothetical protein
MSYGGLWSSFINALCLFKCTLIKCLNEILKVFFCIGKIVFNKAKQLFKKWVNMSFKKVINFMIGSYVALYTTSGSLAKWQVKRWLCGFALSFCQTAC